MFAVFLFYPFFKTIYLSLYKTNKMGQAKLFVGLGNYMELFQSESFYNSLAVTLLFVAIVVAGAWPWDSWQLSCAIRHFRESVYSARLMRCPWPLRPVPQP